MSVPLAYKYYMTVRCTSYRVYGVDLPDGERTAIDNCELSSIGSGRSKQGKSCEELHVCKVGRD